MQLPKALFRHRYRECRRSSFTVAEAVPKQKGLQRIWCRVLHHSYLFFSEGRTLCSPVSVLNPIPRPELIVSLHIQLELYIMSRSRRTQHRAIKYSVQSGFYLSASGKQRSPPCTGNHRSMIKLLGTLMWQRFHILVFQSRGYEPQ